MPGHSARSLATEQYAQGNLASFRSVQFVVRSLASLSEVHLDVTVLIHTAALDDQGVTVSLIGIDGTSRKLEREPVTLLMVFFGQPVHRAFELFLQQQKPMQTAAAVRMELFSEVAISFFDIFFGARKCQPQ